MGSWIRTSHQRFTWWYSPSLDKLFRRIGGSWMQYNKSREHGRIGGSRSYYKGDEIDVVPQDLEASTVGVRYNDNQVRWEGGAPFERGEQVSREEHTSVNIWWEKIIEKEPVETREILCNSYMTITREEMKHRIENNEIVMVSDGSYKQSFGIGTAAFRMEDKGRRIIFQGV